jgi:hypothetical protein
MTTGWSNIKPRQVQCSPLLQYSLVYEKLSGILVAFRFWSGTQGRPEESFPKVRKIKSEFVYRDRSMK